MLKAGHTTITAHMFKLGFTKRQVCRLCRDEKENSVHIVYHCLPLSCKRYRSHTRLGV